MQREPAVHRRVPEQLAELIGYFDGSTALALYRETFRPSARLEWPYAMVCASVLAAEDDDRARYLAGPGAWAFLRLRQGKPGPGADPGRGRRVPLLRAGASLRE